MLANSRHDLVLCHLVSGFNAHDSPTESVTLEPLLKLTLCLARTEDQNRVRVSYDRDDPVVVPAKLVVKAPVLLIFFQ